MTQEHPITPPPKLVRQWATTNGTAYKDLFALCKSVADQAAQWGADQELEECDKALRKIWQMDHVSTVDDFLRELRAARRPKPKSQAEKALASLDGVDLPEEAWRAVSAALERLRDLEKSND